MFVYCIVGRCVLVENSKLFKFFLNMTITNFLIIIFQNISQNKYLGLRWSYVR